MPYTKNAEGKGPAWANSLFEDNAEYGYGMAVAVKKLRSTIKNYLEEIMTEDDSIKDAAQAWIDSMEDGEASKAASKKLEIGF